MCDDTQQDIARKIHKVVEERERTKKSDMHSRHRTDSNTERVQQRDHSCRLGGHLYRSNDADDRRSKRDDEAGLHTSTHRDEKNGSIDRKGHLLIREHRDQLDRQSSMQVNGQLNSNLNMLLLITRTCSHDHYERGCERRPAVHGVGIG